MTELIPQGEGPGDGCVSPRTRTPTLTRRCHAALLSVSFGGGDSRNKCPWHSRRSRRNVKTVQTTDTKGHSLAGAGDGCVSPSLVPSCLLGRRTETPRLLGASRPAQNALP